LLLIASLLCCGTAFSQDGPVLSDELIFDDEELKGDILFIGGYHGVHNHKGELAVAKQNHDFTGYIPIDGRSDSGYVIVNHELVASDPILGDGGGMTVFTVYRPPNGRWTVVDDARGKFRSVDFSEVGGTLANCGGFQTPWGTVLTAEEWIYGSNASIYLGGTGITDTSDFIVKTFNGRQVEQAIPKYQNYDWMVEVDVENARAIRKNYNMGRYGHEGGAILPDGRTILLTDDYVPGFLFKFVANQSRDLSMGRLYVYKQNENGIGGIWLEMPMDLSSMINARQTAAQLGATMLIRTEWAIYHDGKIYITETGTDDSGDRLQKGLKYGASMPVHLTELDKQDGNEDARVHDYYGRILELDMETGHLRTYLEGGQGTTQHFANPDGLAFTQINGHPVLMINEDLNGYSHGRVPAGYNERINEIYALDMTLKEPSVDDLARLAVGPAGCETTGGRFNPDGTTYFVNIQHPKSENKFPFNNSVTVAVRHIDRWIAGHLLGDTQYNGRADEETPVKKASFTFDKKKEFKVFNMDGDMVLQGKKKVIDFHGLHRGSYTLLMDNKLRPLVIP
jgi:secreted PhoX family phosphatase